MIHYCKECGRRMKRGNRDGEAIAWCPACEPHFNRESFLRKVAGFFRSLVANRCGSPTKWPPLTTDEASTNGLMRLGPFDKATAKLSALPTGRVPSLGRCRSGL